MQITLTTCRANNHYDAAESWEGAQNSKPEDLPFTITTFASGEKQRTIVSDLSSLTYFPEAVT